MKRNHIKYATQLATEALIVGAIFIPWSHLVAMAFKNTDAPAYLLTFIAGSSFHLVAEATGMNTYYLHHSAARTWDMERWMAEKNTPRKSRKPKCGICFL